MLWVVTGCEPGDSETNEPPPPGPIVPLEPYVPSGAPLLVDVSAASGTQTSHYGPLPATPIAINDHSLVAFVDLDGDVFITKIALE